MQPFFKPGDQKIFRSPDGVRHPGLLRVIYLFLSLVAIAAGVYWIIRGQMGGGVLLIIGGVVVSGAILYGAISRALMARRMRNRK